MRKRAGLYLPSYTQRRKRHGRILRNMRAKQFPCSNDPGGRLGKANTHKTMKPLTQPETDQLLILLRKLWKYSNDSYMVSIAKSLFALITKKMYEVDQQ